MKKFFSAALLAALCAAQAPALAEERDEHEDSARKTIAVFGDWPYNKLLIDNAKLLIDSVNKDGDVSLVMHLGDIHSGSMPCTSAGILPPVPTSDPGYNQKIFSFFQQFKSPVVYTPGDNEWTDCHRTKEATSAPLNEIASIRTLFFARPGHTLGLTDKTVYTQAEKFDPNFPKDAQYVENVLWSDARVMFVTLNMPGSNNDKNAWTNGFEGPAHQQEIADRTAAAIRWLNTAFQFAMRYRMKGVVIGIQADMWDRFAAAPGGDGLDGYTGFVNELARLSVAFGKPVLLLNGDSHIFTVDKPLADPSSATGQIHKTIPVPNLTRITVQGSTVAPAEWLKLTIDPRSANLFRWQNVPFCKDPLTSCQ